MSDNATEKTMASFPDTEDFDNNDLSTVTPRRKNKKPVLVIAILISVLLIGGMVAVIVILSNRVPDPELAKAKEDFYPPAQVVSVATTASDLSNSEISFSYDSRSRIIYCSYTVNGNQYENEVEYDDDSEKVYVCVYYKTKLILEKEILYSDIPFGERITQVDGFYISSPGYTVSGDGADHENNESNTNQSSETGSGVISIDYTAPTIDNNLDWKQEYKEHITGFMRDNIDFANGVGDKLAFSLVYIDNDDIPELTISGPAHVYPSFLCWITKGGVYEEQMAPAIDSGFTYIERSGLFRGKNAWQGSGGDTIYYLDKEKITKVAYGKYDMFNTPHTFSWKGETVSEETYYRRLNQVFDTNSAKDITESTYTYKEIMELLSE